MKTTAKIIAAAGTAALLMTAGCGGDDETTCDPTVPGNICTIAGSGESGYSGDEGPALEARFSLPQDTIVAPDGTLYILDWNNHRIRSVDAQGIIHHVAGRGELGGTLDDPANDDFNHPTGMLLEPGGDTMLIAAWHNSKIRTLDLNTGIIVDTCGDGRRAYFGDEGPAAMASLDLPASIAFDPQGNLVIMDQANQVLRFIDDTGVIHRLAGQCVIDKGAPCATGVMPTACPSPSGKFTCGDPAMTCSKPCTPGYNGDAVDAMTARFSQPFGQSADPAGRIVFDAGGNLYFADTTNALIRVLGTDGIIRNFAGTEPVAGVPQTGYSGDGGPALGAKLNNPVDLAFGADGTLYFTDVKNHCVRAIGTDGNINTVAGVCGTKGYSGDGGPATAALLKFPYGLDVANGTLYISDTGNQVIRSVLLP